MTICSKHTGIPREGRRELQEGGRFSREHCAAESTVITPHTKQHKLSPGELTTSGRQGGRVFPIKVSTVIKSLRCNPRKLKIFGRNQILQYSKLFIIFKVKPFPSFSILENFQKINRKKQG